MRALLRFLRCRRGVAAAEFVLILPLMILVLAGTVELGNALLLDRKVSRAAHISADLIAQAKEVSTSDLNDVFDAVEEILRPFPSTMQITLSSVYYDPSANSVRVVWSQARNATPRTVGSSFTLPDANMLVPGESVIVAKIAYAYDALFADLILNNLTLNDQAYLKPRRVTQVARI